MKAIQFFIFFVISTITIQLQAQFSTYYLDDEIVINKTGDNTTQNVNISGEIKTTKTIKTIDYGALEMANAISEKNKIEERKYNDVQYKLLAIEVMEDPVKALNSGFRYSISDYDRNWKASKDYKKQLEKLKEESGFDRFQLQITLPGFGIFSKIGNFKVQNLSADNIKTDITYSLPQYNKKNEVFQFENEFENVQVGVEREEVNHQNTLTKIYYHKKELNGATVFGEKGYRATYVWENSLEYGITDYYTAYSNEIGNGYEITVEVTYYGNKTETDFEKLEGRRYYLKGLVDKMVANSQVKNLKLMKKL